MKEIVLKIDDDVYKELKNNIGVRMLTGAAYGYIDAFMAKLVESVDKKDKELVLQFKNKDKK